MSTIFIFAVTAFVISFLAGFVLLRMSYARILFKDSFSPILIALFFCMLAALQFNSTHYDILSNITTKSLIVIFGLAAIIYAVSSIKPITKITPIIILLAVIPCTLLLPQEYLLFEGLLPPLVDKIAIIAIWFLFSFCFQYLNGIDGVACIQSISFAAGLIFLYFVGAAPYILCLLGLILLGTMLAFLAFNLHPSYLNLSGGACQALGFIIAWLLLILGQEQSATSGLVLSLYLLLECLYASFSAALPQNKDKTIYKFTAYYRATLSGLSVSNTAFSTVKISFLLVLFSCFQAYSSNAFSIPILAALICIWFMYRLINWQIKSKSFKEINKEFVADVKENINDIKKQINKDK